MGSELGTSDLEVARVAAVSPAAIWAAWSDPDALASWWGPVGFTSTVRELDLSDGGLLDIAMRGPDGVEFLNVYDFEEVDPPTRIIYVHRGSGKWGLAPSRTMVLIEPETGGDRLRTRVTWRSYYASDEDRRRHLEDFQAESGARELLERLEAAAALAGT